MTITKKPAISTKPAAAPADEAKIQAFLAGAPDAASTVNQPKDEKAASRVKTVRGKRLQITLTIAPELLDQVDAEAERSGMSRASLISLAIRKLLDKS